MSLRSSVRPCNHPAPPEYVLSCQRRLRGPRTSRREPFKVSTTDGSANGQARYQNDKVRVAIIGVGNCACSFVQGVQYYLSLIHI